MVLKTHKIELYNEEANADECGTDGYGHPKVCPVLKATVRGDVQPYRNGNAVIMEFGKLVQGLWVMYLDIHIEITQTYKVKVEGYDGYFRVYDEPQIRGAFVKHKRVVLQREFK